MIAKGKTLNISNGGALLSIPVSLVPQISTDINVTFFVPRSTPNTYMLEEFASSACVTRREPLANESATGVAIRFSRPLELGLEV